jgi:hypothetical protein
VRSGPVHPVSTLAAISALWYAAMFDIELE